MTKITKFTLLSMDRTAWNNRHSYQIKSHRVMDISFEWIETRGLKTLLD
jgi:hypothetical protein